MSLADGEYEISQPRNSRGASSGPAVMELTWGEKAVVIALMASISFSSNLTISIVLPFLPQELNKLGLPGQLLTGFVFAIFPFVILLMSPLCNWLAKKFGRIPLLYVGVPLQAVCVFVFGLGVKIAHSNGRAVVAIFLTCRALQGFGAACANLAIFAIVAEHFSASLGKVMGLNEVIIGVGFMMGPVLGSFIYSLSGFSAPFVAASCVVLASFPIVVLYHKQHKRLKKRQEEEEGGAGAGAGYFPISDGKSISGGELYEPMGLSDSSFDGGFTSTRPQVIQEEEKSFLQQIWGILSWRLLLSAAILLLGTGAFGWVETILSLHLQDDLKFKDKYIGIIFAVINVTYSTFGPAVGALSDKYGYKFILATGMTLTGLWFVLMGPVSAKVAHWLSSISSANDLDAQRYWEVALLACFGVSQSLCMIPTLPAMKESVSGKLDQHTVNTVVMVFNQFQQTGLMFSPPLSGALAPAIGFETTMEIYGFICLALGISSAALFWMYGPVPESGKREQDTLLLDPSRDISSPRLVPQSAIMESDLSGSFSNSLHSPAMTQISRSLIERH